MLNLFHLGLLIVCLLILFFFVLNFTHKLTELTTTTATPSQLRPRRNNDNSNSTSRSPPPFHCFFLSFQNPAHFSKHFSRNDIRTFCYAQNPLCFRHSTATIPSTTLLLTTNISSPFSCLLTSTTDTHSQIPHCIDFLKNVLCAHGTYEDPTHPTCPSFSTLSSLTPSLSSFNAALFVPSFPHQRNIFHFLYTIVTIAQTISVLQSILTSNLHQSRNITIVFRGLHPSRLGTWHRDLADAIITHLFPIFGLNASILTLNFGSHHITAQHNRSVSVCADNSIMIGPRPLSLISWPFQERNGNVPEYSSINNIRIPREAIIFRRVIYNFTGIHSVIPRFDRSFSPLLVKSDIPPSHVIYVHREERIVNNRRTFNKADEFWFRSMLESESRTANFTFSVTNFTSTDGLKKQAEVFRSAGVIIGIHGAALTNSVFAPPFSMLVELAPRRDCKRCYENGAGSGLAYMSFVPRYKADASGKVCQLEGDAQCWGGNGERDVDDRRVVIENEEEREKIRLIFRHALQYNLRIRKRFEEIGYVQLAYEKNMDSYHASGLMS